MRSLFHLCVLLTIHSCSSFTLSKPKALRPSSELRAALKADESTLLIVGLGPLPLGVFKHAQYSGFKHTMHILPKSSHGQALDLMYGVGHGNEIGEDGVVRIKNVDMVDGALGTVQLIDSGDAGILESALSINSVSAIALCADQLGAPTSLEVLEYLVSITSRTLSRISIFSRTFNKKGYGFLVKAARKAANQDIWDQGEAEVSELKMFEAGVKKIASDYGGIRVNVLRGGTLKGGGWGSEVDDDGVAAVTNPDVNFALSSQYYKVAQRDIVNTNLLYDCSVSDCHIYKGDVGVGPGNTAILSANSCKEEPGDSGRKAVAGAILHSFLVLDDDDFSKEYTIRSKEGRTGPGIDVEAWMQKFSTAKEAA